MTRCALAAAIGFTMVVENVSDRMMGSRFHVHANISKPDVSTF
jgi:hypothetical protein